MSDLTFSEKAWEEYLEWQATDKATVRKINGLLKEIARTPFDGIGKPEPLKNALAGLWSRRINGKDRLVYAVSENSIRILQCQGHYEDK
jgi:toxin YoeB